MTPLNIIVETFTDTYLILPLLFIMYLVLEYLEEKQNDYNLTPYFINYGPIFGALLGVIPQCGFGVLASMLFIESKITLGTLISVFIATSDEAIPILLTKPNMYEKLVLLLLLKVVLAMIVGYIVDFLFQRKMFFLSKQTTNIEKHHSILEESFLHAIKIYSFLFIINVVLAYFMSMFSENQLSYILLENSMIQPIICAIFGFIPHCASSVLLTQLYVSRVLSFSSLLAGLITNAGLGILTLLQNKISFKILLIIILILMVSSLTIALPLQWLYFV